MAAIPTHFKRLWVIPVGIGLALSTAMVVGLKRRGWRLKAQAEPFIAAAESYRDQHGEYPLSVPFPATAEAPEGELFYQRQADGSFIIWYGTTLGESTTYQSKTGQWSD